MFRFNASKHYQYDFPKVATYQKLLAHIENMFESQDMRVVLLGKLETFAKALEESDNTSDSPK